MGPALDDFFAAMCGVVEPFLELLVLLVSAAPTAAPTAGVALETALEVGVSKVGVSGVVVTLTVVELMVVELVIPITPWGIWAATLSTLNDIQRTPQSAAESNGIDRIANDVYYRFRIESFSKAL
jgi:hypothetical protein